MGSLFGNGLEELISVPIPVSSSMLIPAMTSVGIVLSLYYNLAYYRDYVEARAWRVQDSEIEMFDFIVVGGGSAGAVVANRLSKHHQVLLLEIGGDPNPISYIPMGGMAVQRIPSTDLMYETVPQNNSALALWNKILFWPRGTDLGGTSNLNAMIYQRGNPNDYDNWANITGNPQWGYDNLLPFFKGLEDYHGFYPNEYHAQGGPMHVEKLRQSYMASYFLKAGREKGYPVGDLNGRQTEGFSELDVTMKKGLRWSTYPGYIQPVLGRTNLKIYRYSRAVKVHLNKRKLAYGVTYYRHGQRRFVRARKEVILSSGAIDSPKILLLSGIGPREHLHSIGLSCRANLPVGQNLQDHLYTLVGPFLVDSHESLIMERGANLKTLLEFTLDRRGIGVSNGFSAVGYVSSSVRNDSSWPDIQYTLTPCGLSELLASTLERISNVRPEVLNEYLKPYFGHDGNFILQTLVRPKSVGELKLASRDPFAKPIIQPNYYAHEDDIQASIDGMKIIVDLFENSTTYKAINARLIPKPFPGCEGFKLKTDEYYECLARHLTFTLYHPAGTAAMGKNLNDSRAVLDSQLRVFKTVGLRVIDASVMPVIINANTNVPSVMIGEVGSNFIRSHWAQQYEVCPIIQQLFKSYDYKCFYSRLT